MKLLLDAWTPARWLESGLVGGCVPDAPSRAANLRCLTAASLGDAPRGRGGTLQSLAARQRPHREAHRTARLAWLRAAVLGAHDGIVSTASLLVGVAAAGAGRSDLWLVGLAGLAAGAMSMAAGEYVSVSSQADSEQADLARERRELCAQPESERQELAAIYVERGVHPELATQVAQQLMQHDALGAHARDELGISDVLGARPGLAAFASALAFAGGASLPLLTTVIAPLSQLLFWLVATSLLVLVALGAVAARTGGAPPHKAALRVGFWGAAAMALTAGVGWLFGPLV
jgi:vacuolar iron transporter family protein